MRRALILIALAGSLAVAGCGGGGGSSGGNGTTRSATPLTKAQYQAKLRQIAQDVAKNVGGASSGKELSKKAVDNVVTAIHAFTKQLGQVTPPAEVATLHTQLISAMNDVADEFPDIADKLNAAQKAKDASAGIAALFGAKGFQELIKLQAAFKAKGYSVNLNG